jgi:hypothetical protein
MEVRGGIRTTRLGGPAVVTNLDIDRVPMRRRVNAMVLRQVVAEGTASHTGEGFTVDQSLQDGSLMVSFDDDETKAYYEVSPHDLVSVAYDYELARRERVERVRAFRRALEEE